MPLFSKIHEKVSLKLQFPNFVHSQTFTPLLHSLYMMFILALYTQSRPPFRYLENKFENVSFILHPFGAQNVF